MFGIRTFAYFPSSDSHPPEVRGPKTNLGHEEPAPLVYVTSTYFLHAWEMVHYLGTVGLRTEGKSTWRCLEDVSYTRRWLASFSPEFGRSTSTQNKGKGARSVWAVRQHLAPQRALNHVYARSWWVCFVKVNQKLSGLSKSTP